MKKKYNSHGNCAIRHPKGTPFGNTDVEENLV